MSDSIRHPVRLAVAQSPEPGSQVDAASALEAVCAMSEVGIKVAEEFIKQLGGPGGLARELKRDFRKAKPGSPERMRIYSFIFGITSKSDDEDMPDELVLSYARAIAKAASDDRAAETDSAE